MVSLALIILLVLLIMAGLVGLVLLVVWLVRRGERPGPPSPRAFSEGHQRTVAANWLSLVEVRDGRPHIRWGIYFLGLGVAVIGAALLNGLLLVAGVWSGMDTVLFGVFVVAVAFNIFVIHAFNKAGRASPLESLSTGGTPPSGPASPNRPASNPPPSSDRCPRCGTTLPPDSPQGLCPRCVMGVGLDTQTEATGEFGPHGTKIVPPPEAEVAKRFPHLEILGCLGHGGMGVVYKARQPKLNRLVALKILAPEKGADPKFAERFLREAQALARLSHPNIVTVHDFGEADGMFFLLMEFVDGMTLRQLLREGRMKPEQALVIVPPICEALQFAHEQGVVHRDIKPENVLLDKQGRVKIADFGIAKLVAVAGQPLTPSLSPSDGERVSERTGEGTLTQDQIIGTPHYMAPEQVEHPQTVDHRADIYSLGVVFYEMLTGELPLGKFQPPSKKVQVDVRLDEVVLHALEKEPDRRYQKASQVKSDVETIATTPSPSSSGRPSAPSEAARPQAVLAASSNAKGAMMAFAGTVFFLFMIAVVEEMFHRAGPVRGFLVVICVVGLAICVLSLAGIWPFPSPWFPDPNFSSRNLRRGTPTTVSTTHGGGAWKVAAVIIAAIAGVGLLVLALPVGYWLLARKQPDPARQQQVSAQRWSASRTNCAAKSSSGWGKGGGSRKVCP